MTKEGGQEWYHSNHYDFAYNYQCFSDTLKGLLSFSKSQSALRAEKRGDCFEVAYATKNLGPRISIPLLLGMEI
jgi:hypothetical protein